MSENTNTYQSPKLCRGLFAEIRELMNQARDKAMQEIMTPLDLAPVVVVDAYGSQLTVTGVSFTKSFDGKPLLTLTVAPNMSFVGDFPKEPEAITTEQITGLDPSQPLPGEEFPKS